MFSANVTQIEAKHGHILIQLTSEAANVEDINKSIKECYNIANAVSKYSCEINNEELKQNYEQQYEKMAAITENIVEKKHAEHVQLMIQNIKMETEREYQARHMEDIKTIQTLEAERDKLKEITDMETGAEMIQTKKMLADAVEDKRIAESKALRDELDKVQFMHKLEINAMEDKTYTFRNQYDIFLRS